MLIFNSIHLNQILFKLFFSIFFYKLDILNLSNSPNKEIKNLLISIDFKDKDFYGFKAKTTFLFNFLMKIFN